MSTNDTVSEIQYQLILFVSGASERSAYAIAQTRQICDVLLSGCVQLAVIDINVDPDAACLRGIVVTPTLLRDYPLPPLVVVGDFADHEKVIRMLQLRSANSTSPIPQNLFTAVPAGISDGV